MKPKPDFATATAPLRCSSLPKLILCELQMSADFLDGEGGGAAQTGTATGWACEQWIKGIAADRIPGLLHSRVDLWPYADLEAAKAMFAGWITDAETQARRPRFIATELAVAAQYRGIHLQGTADLVIQRPGGALEVWDFKTGQPTGSELWGQYLAQLCGYAVCVEQTLGAPTWVGGIVRMRSYMQRKALAWWNLPVSRESVLRVLDQVVESVNRVREGSPRIGPGTHCRYCPVGGVDKCLPQWSV